MNRQQKNTLICAAIVILLMLLFPPFAYIGLSGAKRGAGYAPIFQPPALEGSYGASFQASINTPVLLTQIFGIGAAAGLLVLAFKEKG